MKVWEIRIRKCLCLDQFPYISYISIYFHFSLKPAPNTSSNSLCSNLPPLFVSISPNVLCCFIQEMPNSKYIFLWVEHKLRWKYPIPMIDFRYQKDSSFSDNELPCCKWISPFCGRYLLSSIQTLRTRYRYQISSLN